MHTQEKKKITTTNVPFDEKILTRFIQMDSIKFVRYTHYGKPYAVAALLHSDVERMYSSTYLTWC